MKELRHAITVPAESYLCISFAGEAHQTVWRFLETLTTPTGGYNVEVDGREFRLLRVTVNDDGYQVLLLTPCAEDGEIVAGAAIKEVTLDSATPVVVHVW